MNDIGVKSMKAAASASGGRVEGTGAWMAVKQNNVMDLAKRGLMGIALNMGFRHYKDRTCVN